MGDRSDTPLPMTAPSSTNSDRYCTYAHRVRIVPGLNEILSGCRDIPELREVPHKEDPRRVESFRRVFEIEASRASEPLVELNVKDYRLRRIVIPASRKELPSAVKAIPNARDPRRVSACKRIGIDQWALGPPTLVENDFIAKEEETCPVLVIDSRDWPKSKHCWIDLVAHECNVDRALRDVHDIMSEDGDEGDRTVEHDNANGDVLTEMCADDEVMECDEQGKSKSLYTADVDEPMIRLDEVECVFHEGESSRRRRISDAGILIVKEEPRSRRLVRKNYNSDVDIVNLCDEDEDMSVKMETKKERRLSVQPIDCEQVTPELEVITLDDGDDDVYDVDTSGSGSDDLSIVTNTSFKLSKSPSPTKCAKDESPSTREAKRSTDSSVLNRSDEIPNNNKGDVPSGSLAHSSDAAEAVIFERCNRARSRDAVIEESRVTKALFTNRVSKSAGDKGDFQEPHRVDYTSEQRPKYLKSLRDVRNCEGSAEGEPNAECLYYGSDYRTSKWHGSHKSTSKSDSYSGATRAFRDFNSERNGKSAECAARDAHSTTKQSIRKMQSYEPSERRRAVDSNSRDWKHSKPWDRKERSPRKNNYNERDKHAAARENRDKHRRVEQKDSARKHTCRDGSPVHTATTCNNENHDTLTETSEKKKKRKRKKKKHHHESKEDREILRNENSLSAPEPKKAKREYVDLISARNDGIQQVEQPTVETEANALVEPLPLMPETDAEVHQEQELILTKPDALMQLSVQNTEKELTFEPATPIQQHNALVPLPNLDIQQVQQVTFEPEIFTQRCGALVPLTNTGIQWTQPLTLSFNMSNEQLNEVYTPWTCEESTSGPSRALRTMDLARSQPYNHRITIHVTADHRRQLLRELLILTDVQQYQTNNQLAWSCLRFFLNNYSHLPLSQLLQVDERVRNCEVFWDRYNYWQQDQNPLSIQNVAEVEDCDIKEVGITKSSHLVMYKKDSNDVHNHSLPVIEREVNEISENSELHGNGNNIQETIHIKHQLPKSIASETNNNELNANSSNLNSLKIRKRHSLPVSEVPKLQSRVKRVCFESYVTQNKLSSINSQGIKLKFKRDELNKNNWTTCDSPRIVSELKLLTENVIQELDDDNKLHENNWKACDTTKIVHESKSLAEKIIPELDDDNELNKNNLDAPVLKRKVTNSGAFAEKIVPELDKNDFQQDFTNIRKDNFLNSLKSSFLQSRVKHTNLKRDFNNSLEQNKILFNTIATKDNRSTCIDIDITMMPLENNSQKTEAFKVLNSSNDCSNEILPKTYLGILNDYFIDHSNNNHNTVCFNTNKSNDIPHFFPMSSKTSMKTGLMTNKLHFSNIDLNKAITSVNTKGNLPHNNSSNNSNLHLQIDRSETDIDNTTESNCNIYSEIDFEHNTEKAIEITELPTESFECSTPKETSEKKTLEKQKDTSTLTTNKDTSLISNKDNNNVSELKQDICITQKISKICDTNVKDTIPEEINFKKNNNIEEIEFSNHIQNEVSDSNEIQETIIDKSNGIKERLLGVELKDNITRLTVSKEKQLESTLNNSDKNIHTELSKCKDNGMTDNLMNFEKKSYETSITDIHECNSDVNVNMNQKATILDISKDLSITTGVTKSKYNSTQINSQFCRSEEDITTTNSRAKLLENITTDLKETDTNIDQETTELDIQRENHISKFIESSEKIDSLLEKSKQDTKILLDINTETTASDFEGANLSILNDAVTTYSIVQSSEIINSQSKKAEEPMMTSNSINSDVRLSEFDADIMNESPIISGVTEFNEKTNNQLKASEYPAASINEFHRNSNTNVNQVSTSFKEIEQSHISSVNMTTSECLNIDLNNDLNSLDINSTKNHLLNENECNFSDSQKLIDFNVDNSSVNGDQVLPDSTGIAENLEGGDFDFHMSIHTVKLDSEYSDNEYYIDSDCEIEYTTNIKNTEVNEILIDTESLQQPVSKSKKYLENDHSFEIENIQKIGKPSDSHCLKKLPQFYNDCITKIVDNPIETDTVKDVISDNENNHDDDIIFIDQVTHTVNNKTNMNKIKDEKTTRSEIIINLDSDEENDNSDDMQSRYINVNTETSVSDQLKEIKMSQTEITQNKKGKSLTDELIVESLQLNNACVNENEVISLEKSTVDSENSLSQVPNNDSKAVSSCKIDDCNTSPLLHETQHQTDIDNQFSNHNSINNQILQVKKSLTNKSLPFAKSVDIDFNNLNILQKFNLSKEVVAPENVKTEPTPVSENNDEQNILYESLGRILEEIAKENNCISTPIVEDPPKNQNITNSENQISIFVNSQQTKSTGASPLIVNLEILGSSANLNTSYNLLQDININLVNEIDEINTSFNDSMEINDSKTNQTSFKLRDINELLENPKNSSKNNSSTNKNSIAEYSNSSDDLGALKIQNNNEQATNPKTLSNQQINSVKVNDLYQNVTSHSELPLNSVNTIQTVSSVVSQPTNVINSMPVPVQYFNTNMQNFYPLTFSAMPFIPHQIVESATSNSITSVPQTNSSSCINTQSFSQYDNVNKSNPKVVLASSIFTKEFNNNTSSNTTGTAINSFNKSNISVEQNIYTLDTPPLETLKLPAPFGGNFSKHILLQNLSFYKKMLLTKLITALSKLKKITSDSPEKFITALQSRSTITENTWQFQMNIIIVMQCVKHFYKLAKKRNDVIPAICNTPPLEAMKCQLFNLNNALRIYTNLVNEGIISMKAVHNQPLLCELEGLCHSIPQQFITQKQIQEIRKQTEQYYKIYNTQCIQCQGITNDNNNRAAAKNFTTYKIPNSFQNSCLTEVSKEPSILTAARTSSVIATSDSNCSSNITNKDNKQTDTTEISNSALCLKCKKNSIVLCSRCKKASYCSLKCQTSHWQEEHHKTCLLTCKDT